MSTETYPRARAYVAAAVGVVTKTAHQHLEDLALLGLADRAKTSDAGNAPDLWSASDWLREFWPDPESEREMYVRTGSGFKEGLNNDGNIPPTDTPIRTSRSHFGPEPEDQIGEVFGVRATDWTTEPGEISMTTGNRMPPLHTPCVHPRLERNKIIDHA